MEKYAQGISFEHFEDALEAVRRIAPGGHYLGNSFTLKRLKDAFIAPEILDNWSLVAGDQNTLGYMMAPVRPETLRGGAGNCVTILAAAGRAEVP